MFKVGDIVKHKAVFLQNIGWYTDVPRDGRVVEVDGDRLGVEWCDEPGRVSPILAQHVLPAGAPDYTGL